MIVDLKRNFITKSVSRSPASEQEKVTFVLEMANLGYIVPLDAFSLASKTSLKEILKATLEFKGADKNWTPFYPNFPRQVVEADGWELFWNAFLHYNSVAFGLDMRPLYPAEIREQLEVCPEHLTALTLADEKQLLVSKIEILQNKISLSEDDFNAVTDAIRIYGVEDAIKLVSDFKFENKENWIQTLKIMIDLGVARSAVEDYAYASAKTATDLLRSIFMLYSDENVHIDLTAKNKTVRLKTIPRVSRKKIMETIELRAARFDLDDYFTKRKLWKIVDRKIHPGEFKHLANALNIFGIVRGTISYKTFNSQVEEALVSGSAINITGVLSQRPGIFARRLDHALRSVDEKSQLIVAASFAAVANKVSTPVLMSLYNGLSNRDNAASVVRSKSGMTANVTNIKAPISQPTIAAVQRAVLETISKSYADRDPMGKVYVSPELKEIAAPLQQRTVSTGRILPRGSKIPVNTEDTLRFFVHWYNTENAYNGRVDLDLDAIFLDSNFNSLGYISYQRLRNEFAVHSGDITNAPRPQGAAEFIDIDCKKAKRHNVRYVMMNLNNYSGQNICDIENLVGYMDRKGTQKGEIFDPKTVKSAFSLTTPTRNAIPALFDIVEGRFIWLDTAFGAAGVGYRASTGAAELAETVKLELDKTVLSMYDVITANVKSRGTLVDEKNADTVYDLSTLDIFDSNGFINEFI